MKESHTVMQKNPVVRTGKWAVSLMKNKLVASLMMLVQGILFIAAPAGNMKGTVQIASAVVILACAINILLHLCQKDRGTVDVLLALVNAVFVAAAVFCLASPAAVEPYVRIVVGVITVLTAVVNLIETLKLEKKKGWQFAVGIIAAVVMITLGGTMILAGEAKIEIVQQSSGIFLILSALINIWYVIRLKKAGS